MATDKQVKCIWSLMGYSFTPASEEKSLTEQNERWKSIDGLDVSAASEIITALKRGDKEIAKDILLKHDVPHV